MQQLSIVLKDLVLIGGGHSHVYTIKDFGLRPMAGVRLTLISKDVETPYSGMLPGYVAGYYTREQCHIDLLKLCSAAKVRFIKAEASKIDIENKLIYCTDNRPPISYDISSIDVGITPKLPYNSLRSYDSGSITPVKPIDGFCRKWDDMLYRVLNMNNRVDPLRIVVVGGGAGGVELCFALHYRLMTELNARGREADAALLRVSLINRGSTLMKTHNKGVQKIITRLMAEKGIEVILRTDVVNVTSELGKAYLVTADERRIPYDEAIWCTQASTQGWIKDSGLEVTSEGFICVDSNLESTNTKNVFACGDVSHFVNSPRPKAGVFAVRAGPPLTANLRRRLAGLPLEPWSPQTQFLGIIGTGGEYAVASRGPLAIEGAYLWTLKDNIDNTWMNDYRGLGGSSNSGMGGNVSKDDQQSVAIDKDAEEALAASSMRCGGCGSKLGGKILTNTLEKLKTLDSIYVRDEVVLGIGSDAALIRPSPEGFLQVQTVDYFRSFIGDSFLLGKIAAMHALSDIYAMNGEAVSALATCVLQYGLANKVEQELLQMIAGVCAVLSAEKCSLVGGHSSEGLETALGISVNGIVPESEVFATASKFNDGDVIILSKPLGTGAIFAADMRGEAKGPYVWEAIESMLVSNKDSARLFRQMGCTACTDVTGFGLIGHLAKLLQGEERKIQVELDLVAVPLFQGAIEAASSGRYSSLHSENYGSYSSIIENAGELASNNTRYQLLFDPQTSGGLCGIIPKDRASETVAALRSMGYSHASIIGRVESLRGKDKALFRVKSA